MQINYKTKVRYQGQNMEHLNHVQRSNGYKKNLWLTFNQAREMGLKVKKGEKGTRIVRVVENEEVGKKSKIGVRVYVVFNIEQIEGK